MAFLCSHGAYPFLKRFVTHIADDSEEGRKGRTVIGGIVLAGAAVKTSMTIYTICQKYYLRKSKFENAKRCKNEILNLVKEPNRETDLITELPVSELVEKLQKGELKPEAVVAAFQAKALDVDKRLNCITEPVMGAANDARHLETSDKAKGAMYGIPISLKDNIGLKGYDCTKGLALHINHPMTDDAVLVKVLRKQGAIPFVKTNVPQTLLSYHCSNPVFGRTKHPLKPTHTPGGSSGGEAALIAGGGSILGVGTDVAGSIRIPAHMSGVCGIKSTSTRISSAGNSPGWKSFPLFNPVVGFLSRDMDGLILAMRSVLVPLMFELDPQTVPLPFNEETFNSKQSLRIGYYTYDGFVHATPACERAVKIAKEALERKGHKLVPWTPPKVDCAFDLALNGMFGDGLQNALGELEYDAIDEKLAPLYYAVKILPDNVRRFVASFFGLFSTQAGRLLKLGLDAKNVNDWWKISRKRKDYIEEVTSHWSDNRLDAVICPGFAVPSIPYGMTITFLASYTALYNVLDFPAGTVPVTKVSQQDQEQLINDYPTHDFVHRMLRKVCMDSEGMPVGVQVVSTPWKEEICLRLMKEIEDNLES